MTSTTISIMIQIRDQFWVVVSDESRAERNWKEGCAYLKSAHKSVVDLVLEQLGAVVLHARPSPHVLVLAVIPTVLQDAGSQSPHDHADDEPADGEEGVVHAHLLGPPMSAAAIADEDEDADGEGDAGGGENELLWPRVGFRRPWGHAVLCWESLGGVEDGEGGGQHGEDDQAAAEVDAAECKLG